MEAKKEETKKEAIREKEEERKDRKERTTKRLIIPAKYFLEEVADDAETVYPLTLISRNGGNGQSRIIESREELLSATKIVDVYTTSLVLARKRAGHYCIDLRHGGYFEVEKDFMPERQDKDTLLRPEVKRFYDGIFGKRQDETEQGPIGGGTILRECTA